MGTEKLRMRLRMLFLRRRAGLELDRELQFHLDQQIEENVAAGMSLEEARKAALRSFGSPATLRDQARNTWSWLWLELLFSDVRYGFRTLARTPGFALLAMLVIALGIGANVALFTVVHKVLLRPLPFPDQDRLVRLYEADMQGRFQDNLVAGGTFASWQQQAQSFQQLAAKSQTNYNLAGSTGQPPEMTLGGRVSWGFFPLLGVQAALGRVFLPADDRREADATVLLSWGLWERRYGGDPGILGRTILLDARPYTVIGVLPQWFNYPDPKIQLWTALYHEKTPEIMALHTAHNLDAVARLKPGVTIAQATADLNTIQRQLRHQYPDGPVNDAANIRPILDAEVHRLKTGLYTLLAATGCLLLIASLNVANLLLARAAVRRREAAIRTALGGSRIRLIRQQVIESLLLCAAGAGVGLLIAEAALRWLVSARTDLPRAGEIHVDGLAVLFTAAIVIACGLLAGLMPALSSDRKQLLSQLQESSRSHSAGNSGVRLRRLLLAVQVGLTVVLLTAAGLLIRSYSRLRAVDLGLNPHHLLTMGISLPRGSYKTSEAIVAFDEQLMEQVRLVPGVQDVTLTTIIPNTGRQRDDVFAIREHPPVPKGQSLDADTYFVAPSYFSTLQIPLLQGRFFRSEERLKQTSVVIVNQKLVRQFFPGENALGKHLQTDLVGELTPGDTGLEIIGVVADTLEDAASPAYPTIYYPLFTGTERFAMLLLRTSQDPASVALPVQKAIAGLDSNLAVANILTMDQLIGQSTQAASFNATLLLAFAVLSLLLAAVGLFGVVSYMAAQRTTEIGIRIALGARREQILQLMLRDGLRPAIFGLAAGLVVSAPVTRLIRATLFATSALDPLVFVTVSMMLLVVAAIACAIPAWRASRLDPVQALRSE